MSEFIIPDVFNTMEISYPSGDEGKAAACADGLSAWGIVACGVSVPNFGETMVMIGRFVGCTATPEGLANAARELGYLE